MTLVEKASPFLQDEAVRVVAIAQAGLDPRVPMGGGVGGAVLVVGGLLSSDTYLPQWAGGLGVAIFSLAMLAGYLVKRRLILRTDKRLYVFDVPRSRSAPLAAPLSIHELDAVPPRPGARAIKLGGERLWPYFDQRDERDAIAAALGERSR